MKIAILGSNGYLGRNLLHAAVSQGHEVMAYDRSETQADNFQNYQQIDMSEASSMSSLDLDADAVYMLVGRTGTSDGFNKYEEFIASNEISLLNLLSEYRRQNSKAKIVFPSTRLVYRGRPEALKEDDPKEFKTIYAVGKYSGEQYLSQYHNLFGINYCILRLCIPFGTEIPEASSYGTLEFMLSKAKAGQPITLYGDGSLRRTFTHIADVTDIFLTAGSHAVCQNDVFNIGGNTYSLLEVANLIADQYGVEVQHVEWPPVALALESGDTVFDDARLAAEIGPINYQTVEIWLKAST